MNERQNPFADPGAASKRAAAKRHFLILVVLLAASGVGIGAWMAYNQHVHRLERVQGEVDQVRALAARSETESAELREKLASSLAAAGDLKDKLASSLAVAAGLQDKLTRNQARVADLEKEKETAAQAHQGLEQEMRAKLDSKDVTISQLQGKLTVNILDRILFDSGEAVLKPAGETVLQKIAGILVQRPTLKVHVIGHTDNVPIRPNARSRFTSNWDLSTARALAAVRFLTETAGVDPRSVGAVGYGEFRPLADNSTREGRSQNRRIAITILADELAGADTVRVVKTNWLANPPPVVSEPDNATVEAK